MKFCLESSSKFLGLLTILNLPDLTYRSRQELFASVLRSAAKHPEGIIFTRMMYESLLSYTQLSKILKDILNAGMLANEPDITKYKITSKGLRFLELIEKMNDLIKH
jgi:predicted transcriptional regulator